MPTIENIALTLPPPNGRGCGDRKKGGLYLSVGTGEGGTPFWKFLCDPPLPYYGEKFRGTPPAPPELTGDDWPEETLLLVDMIGMEHYPTTGCYMEEARRYGFSRNVSPKTDFESWEDKGVALALIHWRAIASWGATEDWGALSLPPLLYTHCQETTSEWVKAIKEGEMIPAGAFHYHECVYHGWPNTMHHLDAKKMGGGIVTQVTMPSFDFDIFNVAETPIDPRVGEWPEPQGYQAGVFAIIPPEFLHIEAVQYVPEDCNVAASGIPVIVVEE